jgi:hypothetical protein
MHYIPPLGESLVGLFIGEVMGGPVTMAEQLP